MTKQSFGTFSNSSNPAAAVIMTEREQTLADFQACTGLDDIELCITILDQYEWNLTEAVKSMMPEDHHDGTSSATIIMPPEPQFMDLAGASNLPTPSQSIAAGASASMSYVGRSSSPRLLHFTVEYHGKTTSVIVPDTETIGKLKEIFSKDLSLSLQDLQLCGFKSKRIEDTRVLRDLDIPDENKLYILTPNVAVPVSTRSTPMSDNPDQTYVLNVTYNDDANYRQFKITLTGLNTIRDVKHEAYARTDVPIHLQDWSGWPNRVASDSVRLCDCGICPTHDLTLARLIDKPSPTTQPSVPPNVCEAISSDEDEVYESFPDEEIFVSDDTQSSRSKTLLPLNATDNAAFLEFFTSRFYERYGSCHPVFYVGSLENAVRDSLLVKARQRKPLAIYLHHDGSILSNVFCSQILCSESVVNYLTENFILWPWDITHESNKTKWLSLTNQHFGVMPTTQLQMLSVDQLPTLFILMRSRGSNEVVSVIPGSNTLDEFMTSLIHAVEVFQRQQSGDITEEDERDRREMIKQEQDDAYELSLQADRAKSKAVKEQLDQISLAEEKRQEDLQVKEAIMKSLALTLPQEPPPTCTDSVSKFRVRTPTGEIISRAFLAAETLETLLKFIKSVGYDAVNFKVLTTFPRRDITELDLNTTLLSLSLYPQETLTIEER